MSRLSELTNNDSESCTIGSLNNKDDSLRAIVTNELARIGASGPWVWKLFFLCVTPNILNGFHVSSYVFLGQMPDDHWCVIPELLTANWTHDQMRYISSTKPNELGDGCRILNWDYLKLSTMTYDEAILYTKLQDRPDQISCRARDNVYQHYEQEEGVSIVPEWDLVCENSFWRTTVQVAVSVGKFMGATIFGILSDKYGRKTCFCFGALLYITGSLLTCFSPWYWLFLIGRVALGSSSSGLFYPAFSMLTENIGIAKRSWMSIAFNMSYPVGMMLLAFSANFIHQWRQLQLSLTIPAFFLIFYCYFLKESPRWLLSKDREEEAYKVVFTKKKNIEFTGKSKTITNKSTNVTFLTKFKSSFSELTELYGPSKYRRMALICHFTWFVTSLSYYVTALNADNIAANRIVYVAATGGVDFIGYILSIILLRFMGRKPSICLLFTIAAISLLSLLTIPKESVNWMVFLAMFGRFGISAVYSIVTLHTAEMFPTVIRNSALGTCSTMAHVGSIAAPYIVDFMGVIAWYIPTTICGVLVLLGGLLTLTQPETRQSNLQDDVKESK